jgi:hypothetical protein
MSDLSEPSGTFKRFESVRSTVQIVKDYFWPFLSAYEIANDLRILEPRDVTTATLLGYIDWLRLKQLKAYISYAFYRRVARLFKYLIDTYPDLISDSLEIPTYDFRGVQDSIVHRAPYSDREAFEIERAALKDIRTTVLRLRDGTELLARGKDPRGEGSWRDKADLLWYIKNEYGGRTLTFKNLLNSGCTKVYNVIVSMPAGTKRELYEYLYPSIKDLIPALIAICLKTGLNPQSALDLRRDCLKAVPSPGRVGIIATKYRTGGAGPKTFQKIVDNRSFSSPGGIIRTFLNITAPCLHFLSGADRDLLWVSLDSKRGFRRLPAANRARVCVKEFAKRHNLVGDNGQPLQLSLARLRTTWLTKRYKTGGNLAAVSKEAKHGQISTTRGYIDNPHTLPIHEQTIADGLQDFYDSVRSRVLTQSAEDPEQLAHTTKACGMSVEQTGSLLRGEQDVFISACKDFYNRPGGPADTPCDRPWACFTCKNAYWTRRTLPRLIRFMDFLIEQRQLLTAEDWGAKFGLPFGVITQHILPAFSPEVVAEARLTAATENFTVPISMRVV